MFRPGDVILDTDPNFDMIVSAAPDPSGLKAFPLNVTMQAAADAAIAARLRGVPDDEVQTTLLAAAASGGVVIGWGDANPPTAQPV